MREGMNTGSPEDAGQISIDNIPTGYSLDNRYLIMKKIGKGGFGTVYLVWDDYMGDNKALKFIHREYYDNKIMIHELKHETSILKRVQSKYVVRLWDIHLNEDFKYLDLEYVEGGDLTDLMFNYPDKKVPERTVFKLAEQISKGMQDIHEQHIIHKDLKPQNIMLDAKGCVKIMDFGLSEAYNSMQSRLKEVKRKGTPAYMSPEQLMSKEVGRESDVWSFGVLLYEMLSGKMMYSASTYDDVLMQIKEKEFEPIEHISVPMNELIGKCLQRDYKERFRSFKEIEDFLNAMKGVTPVVQEKNEVHEEVANCEDQETTVQQESVIVQPIRKRKKISKKQIRLSIIALTAIIALILVYNVLSSIEINVYISPVKKWVNNFLDNVPDGEEINDSIDELLVNLNIDKKNLDARKLEFVAGGKFQMGSTDGDSDEEPVHEVKLSSYAIGRNEVTHAEVIKTFNWARERKLIKVTSAMVINSNGELKELINLTDTNSSIFWNGDSLCFKITENVSSIQVPCIFITWYGAAAYCNFISIIDGLTPCYDYSNWGLIGGTDGYRLPTEAEWEYAAKGGKKKSSYKYSGGNNASIVAEFLGNNGKGPVPVGERKANALGLNDMSGNVWEWCNDFYGKYSGSPQIDPTGRREGSYKVLRGGSWSSIAYNCRVTTRAYEVPGNSYSHLGFRIAKSFNGE